MLFTLPPFLSTPPKQDSISRAQSKISCLRNTVSLCFFLPFSPSSHSVATRFLVQLQMNHVGKSPFSLDYWFPFPIFYEIREGKCHRGSRACLMWLQKGQHHSLQPYTQNTNTHRGQTNTCSEVRHSKKKKTSFWKTFSAQHSAIDHDKTYVHGSCNQSPKGWTVVWQVHLVEQPCHHYV